MENIQEPLKLKGGCLAEMPIICFWHYSSLGDIGTINGDGGFDFYFNVVKKPSPVPDATSNELNMPGGFDMDVDSTAPVANLNGLPLHAELSFLGRLPEFDLVTLTAREVKYNSNDCHPGKVIGRYITHSRSGDGQISLQIP
jgi:hypothetical protein